MMPELERLLSQDQIRVVELVTHGLTDRQIAARLGVSESTVQRRIREASRILGTGSRVDLAVRAVSSGLVRARERDK